MGNEDILLQTIPVSNIKGTFLVPSYQRGYRWSEIEVETLLEDILANGNKNYCLQPIVVRKTDSFYELIDGQQRLTTLYLIYKYFRDKDPFQYDEPAFNLTYQTRKNSEDFLKTLEPDKRNENIDYFFIVKAYETINNWFEDPSIEGSVRRTKLRNISQYLDNNVSVIWYEVNEDEDPIALFTRLNIGKIPLSDAELVKSLFLHNALSDEEDKKEDLIKSLLQNGSSSDEKRRTKLFQREISLQWDDMEQELRNDSFWYFLSNSSKEQYPSRIELVLELIASEHGQDKYKTKRNKHQIFFYFDNEFKAGKNIEDIWFEVTNTFLRLKDWYENHDLYHKIGYLIASDTYDLQEIYHLSNQYSKKQFSVELDNIISESIRLRQGKNYSDLSYDNDSDAIGKLLLLFNVESVRQTGDKTQRFPFDKFKFDNNGKETWSLEHIHAQNSENLNREADQLNWIKLHFPYVRKQNNIKLTARMQEVLEKNKISGNEFDKIQREVIDCLSPKGENEYIHSIGNLALLNTRDNAALNNSIFDVKREAIIKMDKNGEFIPFCTRMVFLKYYNTQPEDSQIHFWGQSDRNDYIKAINEVLKDYLGDELIDMETGE